MNKVVIPSILVITILISGFLAFSPIEKVSTAHTTITGEVSGLDVRVFASGPAPDAATADIELASGPGNVTAGTGAGQIEIDILVLDSSGDGVTGLVVGDFTFTFTARDGGGVIAEIDGDFDETGDGLYTISADGDNDLGDQVVLGYIVTVVVDDNDNSATAETGTGVTSMNVIATVDV